MIEPKRIKSLRDRLGWNQFHLASALRVSVHAVSAWERGLRPMEGPAAKLFEILEDLNDIGGDDDSEGQADVR